MRAAAAVALAALLAGCAIPPPPPAPDPPIAGLSRDGRLAVRAPEEAAFCVSQEEPLAVAVQVPDGAAVRPAPETATERRPDFALTLRRPPLTERRLPLPVGADWRLQVAGDGPESAALAARLHSALATCAPQVGTPPR